MNSLNNYVSARPISRENAKEVHAIISDCSKENVVPLGYSFSLSDTMELLEKKEPINYGQFSEVMGVFDVNGVLEGFCALQPFVLDDSPCLEFMIFFRSTSRGTGIPLQVASQLLRRVRTQCDASIITLVFGMNTKGKRFYTRAGFAFERDVAFEKYALELWKLRDTVGND